MKEELKEMAQQGIIKPAKSEWFVSIIIVRKKDGTLCALQMCALQMRVCYLPS